MTSPVTPTEQGEICRFCGQRINMQPRGEWMHIVPDGWRIACTTVATPASEPPPGSVRFDWREGDEDPADPVMGWCAYDPAFERIVNPTAYADSMPVVGLCLPLDEARRLADALEVAARIVEAADVKFESPLWSWERVIWALRATAGFAKEATAK